MMMTASVIKTDIRIVVFVEHVKTSIGIMLSGVQNNVPKVSIIMVKVLFFLINTIVKYQS